jgi:hypothetical protein
VTVRQELYCADETVLRCCFSYIKRETAVFFGVEESNEDEQHARWLDRRKRLAVRKYGALKEEFVGAASTARSPRIAVNRKLRFTSAYASQASLGFVCCFSVLLTNRTLHPSSWP